MSGITTTQSKIAEDLDAFALASWFTSTYLIAMSSMSPLTARLAQIFSPRNCVLGSSILFAIGGLVVSQAPSLKYFLLGRAIQGSGGAGIMTISFILVLELAGKKRRGLYIGLVNTGFTTGVSFGAVIAGALLHVTGWVRSPLPSSILATYERSVSYSGSKLPSPFSSESEYFSASLQPSPLAISPLPQTASSKDSQR